MWAVCGRTFDNLEKIHDINEKTILWWWGVAFTAARESKNQKNAAAQQMSTIAKTCKEVILTNKNTTINGCVEATEPFFA